MQESEKERKLRLILRQIRDIQSQADQILSGDNSSAAIENFSRYSVELKDYILKYVEDENISTYLIEIPDVNYRRVRIKLWHYMILPLWWIALYNDYWARNRTIREINAVKGKYAGLELLIKRIS